MALPVAPPLQPMLGKLARELPVGDYLYEPKWDGFRCLAFRERTLDCVLAGFRRLVDRPALSSLLLGLYGARGELRHVGVASSFGQAQRRDSSRSCGRASSRSPATRGSGAFQSRAAPSGG